MGEKIDERMRFTLQSHQKTKKKKKKGGFHKMVWLTPKIKCNFCTFVFFFLYRPSPVKLSPPPSDPLEIVPPGGKSEGGTMSRTAKRGDNFSYCRGGRLGVKKGEQRLSPRLP